MCVCVCVCVCVCAGDVEAGVERDVPPVLFGLEAEHLLVGDGLTEHEQSVET